MNCPNVTEALDTEGIASMPTTDSINAHGLERAVLYARVSTADQAEEDKTSLPEQLRKTRRYAKQHGYTVVDEIPEEASGRKLHTRGLDKIRALAEAGAIDAVVVLNWGRLSRTVRKYEALTGLMDLYGVNVLTVDDGGRSDKTPMDKARNRVMVAFREFDRDDLIKRTQDGKIGQARRGNVIPSRTPPFGFTYNKEVRTYDVDPVAMAHVRRVVTMIADGHTLGGVEAELKRRGVKKDRSTIKRIVEDDIYKAHTPDEIRALIAADNLSEAVAAAKIKPGEAYGVSWYNRKHIEVDPDDSTRRRVIRHPENEHVAVPVNITDADIPRALFDRARANVATNIKTPDLGRRQCTLKRRVRCWCGLGYTQKPNGQARYYYVCGSRKTREHAPLLNADKLERVVESFVCGLLENPETLRAQVTAQVEAERKRLRDPEKDIRVWTAAINKADGERARNQEMYRAGADVMSLDELQQSNAELVQRRATAQAELDKLRDTEWQIAELDDIPRRVEALLHELSPALANYPLREKAPPSANGGNATVQVPPEEAEAERASACRELYRLIDLMVTVQQDGTLVLAWRGGLTNVALPS
jgi:DNA invertase Pin-like site-specific DNA recombinase